MFTFDPKKEVPLNCEKILRGWHTLSVRLRDIDTLEICNTLFQYEFYHEHRTLILERLASRAAKLAGRQVKELMINEAFERDSHRNNRKRRGKVSLQKSEIPEGDPI